MTIKNREQVIEQLAEILMQLAKECHRYQTDIYMYIDENGNGSLNTFVNVGGNSWLDDDHYTIYSDKEHFDAYNGYYNDADTEFFAEICGFPVDQLEKETCEYLGWDADDEVDSSDVYKYCTNTYWEQLQAAYEDAIDEYSSEYYENAEIIFSNFEEDQESIVTED